VRQSRALDLAVLGLLKERPMHGYELRKQLGGMLGPLWQVSWGSLYPSLRRLARDGAVAVAAEAARPRARASKAGKAGLGAGRRRTVYEITDKGDAVFSGMLEEAAPAVDEEHFALKLAFFRYLRPESRIALLERRRAYLQDKLAQFRSNLRTYRERMDGYALSLQNHDMAVTENDIRWIDELITKEIGPQGAPAAVVGTPDPSRKSTVQQGLDA
jgi:DNA-binding PadR family transcriptional regulator